jgi:nucleoside-diphosphate-sugar epimerase
MRDETITVHGEEGRQFIGVTDLARAYLAALTAPGNRETYAVVSRDFIRWAEIARDIVDLVQLGEVEIKDVHIEPHGFDTLKLRERLGLAFEARPAMREYLEYLIAKERSSA